MLFSKEFVMELRKQNSVRPQLEQLEDRLSPTTLTVTPPVPAAHPLPATAKPPQARMIGDAASHASSHAGANSHAANHASTHVVVIK